MNEDVTAINGKLNTLEAGLCVIKIDPQLCPVFVVNIERTVRSILVDTGVGIE